jgi:DNA-binding response OmpR family regulator
MKPTTIVLVEHDEDALAVLRRVCDLPGFLVAHAADADAAMRYIERHQAAAVILPQRLTPEPLAWIAQARQAAPDALIIVTGDDLDFAVLDAGADLVLGALDEPKLASALQLICAKAAPAEQAGRISLVIVEPDPHLATVMLRWLDGAYDARLVATGWRALELIREQAPDAVLAELRLPDMDASEFYEAVHQAVPTLSERLLFMTAGFVADRSQQFLARIPGQWIYKPFDLQRLRAALIKLFD